MRLRPFPALLCLACAVAAPAATSPAAKSSKGPAPARAPEKEETPSTAGDRHKVKRGETLWGIARLHSVSVGDLMDLNRLSDTNLKEGQVLKIPRPGADPALAPSKPTSHTVAKGETFRAIARKYGITQDDLEHANPKVDPAAPKAGTKLTIPAAPPPAPALAKEKDAPSTPKDKDKPREKAATGTTHTVAERDTFYTIGRKYGVSEEAIAKANPGVKPERLRPGLKLVIPAKAAEGRRETASAPPAPTRRPPSAGAAEAAESGSPAPQPKLQPETRRYIVSAEETAETIAEAFHITVKKLYEINGLDAGSPLKAGQAIKVPGRSVAQD